MHTKLDSHNSFRQLLLNRGVQESQLDKAEQVLVEANPGVDPANLQPGQKIVFPDELDLAGRSFLQSDLNDRAMEDLKKRNVVAPNQAMLDVVQIVQGKAVNPPPGNVGLSSAGAAMVAANLSSQDKPKSLQEEQGQAGDMLSDLFDAMGGPDPKQLANAIRQIQDLLDSPEGQELSEEERANLKQTLIKATAKLSAYA